MRRLLPLALCLVFAPPAAAAPQDGRGPGRAGARACAGPEPTKAGADEEFYPASELTCKAVLLSGPTPEYPRAARRDRAQGTVRLRVALLASGKIGEVEVVKGLPDGISEAAVEAARRIKFRPAVKDDRRVSQRVIVEYNFNTY